MPATIRNPRPARSRQTGVAALEFALIASLSVLMLTGMLVYWHALQTQQSVTRAAGDGARMVQHLVHSGQAGFGPSKPSDQANVLQAATVVVQQSLAASGLPIATSPVQVQIHWSSEQAVLQVAYPLPPLLGGGMRQGSLSLTEPSSLQASSLIQLTPPR